MLCPSAGFATVGVVGARFSSLMWEIAFKTLKCLVDSNMRGHQTSNRWTQRQGIILLAFFPGIRLSSPFCSNQMESRWLLIAGEPGGLCKSDSAVRGLRYTEGHTSYFFSHLGGPAISCLRLPSIPFFVFPSTCLLKRTAESEMLIFPSNQWWIYSLRDDLLEK